MFAICHAVAFRYAGNVSKAVVGLRLARNGATTQPGEETIRVRAFDDEFADLAR
jgi:hypothetical protein